MQNPKSYLAKAIQNLYQKKYTIPWVILLIITVLLPLSGYTIEVASNQAFLEFGQLFISYSWMVVLFIYPLAFLWLEYRNLKYEDFLIALKSASRE